MNPQNKLEFHEKDIKNSSQLRKELWKVVEKWTGDPRLIDFASKLIKGYKVPERDEISLARAIQVFSQNKIKYFRERPERFASPIRTIKWRLGDCDDKSILIAAFLRSFRIPVKLKFIKYQVKQLDGTLKKISHVYPLAFLNNKWTAIESVHKWALGDDPENRALAKGLKPDIFLLGDK